MSKAYLDPSMVSTMPNYPTTTVDGRVLPLYLVNETKTSRGQVDQIDHADWSRLSSGQALQ